MALIHRSLNPISCYVNLIVTQNFKGEDKWVKAKIIGISSYPGYYPTFTVLIEGKYFFNNVPIHCLAPTERGSKYEIRYAYFEKVVSGKFVITTYDYLVGQFITFFDKDGKRMYDHADYLFTIDWYNNNVCLNLLSTPDGFLFRPNHKIIINASIDDTLPAYKKLTVDFK